MNQMERSADESGRGREGARKPRESTIRYVLGALLVGVIYYFSAKLGHYLSLPPDDIAVFWPPNTVILTVLLLTRPGRAWIYFLVMLPAYLLSGMQADYTPQRLAIFFVANCAEILIAAIALRHILKAPPRFSTMRDVASFVACAVLAAPLASACISSIDTALATRTSWRDVWLAWRTWFLGDSLAHLTLTPVLLTWTLAGTGWIRKTSWRRWAEAAGLAGCLFIVGGIALGGEVGSSGNLPALVYTPLPLLLWAAIRFGPQGACSATFIITLLAIWNAVHGRGPFTTMTPAINVLSLQLFLAVISIPIMLLAALMRERERAEQETRLAQEELLDLQRKEKESAEAELAKVRQELVTQTRLATIGQVAASIAHELRNPLGAVRNAVFYLKRHVATDNPKFPEYLGMIDQEVGTAENVIRNMLEMAQSKEPVKSAVDLDQLFQKAIEEACPDGGIRLNTTLASVPFIVQVDSDQFLQVAGNILTNAVQAMNGKGEIQVHARHDHDHDEITVTDDGPGVQAEHRESIFEPLFTTKAKGTGLGLTICRQIVERHGGTLDLLSPDSAGATFRIRLPR